MEQGYGGFESSQALDYKTGAPSSVQNREMEEGGYRRIAVTEMETK